MGLSLLSLDKVKVARLLEQSLFTASKIYQKLSWAEARCQSIVIKFSDRSLLKILHNFNLFKDKTLWWPPTKTKLQIYKPMEYFTPHMPLFSPSLHSPIFKGLVIVGKSQYCVSQPS